MTPALRILLVEDDAEDALLFGKRLPAGFRLVHVRETELAMSILRGAGCDVCFTDYRLGADTGLELVRQVRAEGLNVPMVVITGQDIESLGENALLAGATDFLPKDDLCAASIQRVARWAMIRRLVENRQAVGRSAASR